jgi:hypothetical protein
MLAISPSSAACLANMQTPHLLGKRRRYRAPMRAGGIKAKLLTFSRCVLIVIGVLPIIVAKTPLATAALPQRFRAIR